MNTKKKNQAQKKSKMKRATQISNQPCRWDTDIERLILYADFMGFKERVINTKPEELKINMLSFREKWDKQMKSLKLDDNLRYSQFSDSILIVANGVDEKMFNRISKAAARLMHVALSEGFALKGVIAQGTFTYDEEHELYYRETSG